MEKRRHFSPKEKAKIVLEVLKEDKTLNELAAKVLYILSSIGVFRAGYFTYDAGSGNPIIGNPKALILIGTVQFIIPFSLGAIYFRSVFRS